MLYAFGDVEQPREDTVKELARVTEQYMKHLVRAASLGLPSGAR